jgi:hypothetical protein
MLAVEPTDRASTASHRRMLERARGRCQPDPALVSAARAAVAKAHAVDLHEVTGCSPTWLSYVALNLSDW